MSDRLLVAFFMSEYFVISKLPARMNETLLFRAL